MGKQITDKFIYDTSNEQIVIRSAMADEKTRKALVRQLSTSEFLVPAHGPIWKALIEMTNKSLDFDPATFTDLLKNESVGGADLVYATRLAEGARLTKNLTHHIDTMGWDATRARALDNSIPELLEAIRDPKAPPQDVIAAGRAVAKALEVQGGRRHAIRPTDHHRNYMAEVRARRSERNVFPVGEPEFDKHLTEGFAPGKTALIAGLSGAGKSTFALALTVMLAKMGRQVTYCAWEMSPSSATDVLCSHMLGIDLKDIVQGQLTDAETLRVDRCVQWISTRIKFIKNPFYDDMRANKKRPSNERNLDIVEGYIADTASHVFVYDLWARCLAETRPSDEMAALMRMQHMHEEYQVNGILIHQINLKDVERRADKRPTRDAIKGSGGYVEVPDLILGIHRDAQFKDVKDTTIESICLKQRKGIANWSVQWQWDGATCKVENPKEVSFDPGLDSVSERGDIGDIDDIKVGGSKSRSKRRPGRDS